MIREFYVLPAYRGSALPLVIPLRWTETEALLRAGETRLAQEDAQRWGFLSPTERIVEALDDVAQIHPQVRDEFEVGASQNWADDEFAGGAFVLFEPEQQTLLHTHIIAPEGRLYFAGEHCSLTHRWIQGAIESGLRSAHAIHMRPEG